MCIRNAVCKSARDVCTFFFQVKMTELCRHTNAAYLRIWMYVYVTMRLVGWILLSFLYTIHFYKETKIMLRYLWASGQPPQNSHFFVQSGITRWNKNSLLCEMWSPTPKAESYFITISSEQWPGGCLLQWLCTQHRLIALEDCHKAGSTVCTNFSSFPAQSTQAEGMWCLENQLELLDPPPGTGIWLQQLPA